VLYLMGSILLEVVGTLALKASQGMTRPSLVGVTLACYLGAFLFWGLALRRMDVSVAYAIWAGLGTAFTAVGGVLLFHEPATPLRFLFLLLIVAGVMGLQWTGATR